jgi:type I restriction enzyme S subunit
MPAKTQVISALAALPGSSLGDLFDSVREMVDPSKHAAFGLGRNFDVTDALEPVLDDEHELVDFADVGSTKKRMRRGDVAISRLRAYLKEIAVVNCSDDSPAVGSSEFILLRPKSYNCPVAPTTLTTFLRSEPVQTILKWCQDGSQHPRFSEADLLAIPLPDAVATASPTIEALVADVLLAGQSSRRLIAAAKRAVEIAIEQDEAAALRFLDKAES